MLLIEKVLVDDRTGECAPEDDVQEVTLTPFGTEFRLEMSAESRREYLRAVEPWLRVARRKSRSARIHPEIAELLGIQPRAGGEAHKRHTKAERKAMDAWLGRHGITVAKGRKTSAMWEAFRADDPDRLRQHA